MTAGGRRRRTPAWHPEPDTEPAAPAGSPNPPRSMVLGSLCGAGRGRQGPEKKRIEALLVWSAPVLLRRPRAARSSNQVNNKKQRHRRKQEVRRSYTFAARKLLGRLGPSAGPVTANPSGPVLQRPEVLPKRGPEPRGRGSIRRAAGIGFPLWSRRAPSRTRAERCLLHDTWSGRTEDGWDQKGHGDLRRGKSAALAGRTGVAGWCLLALGKPRKRLRVASFIKRAVCALLKNSTIALGKDVSRALSCGREAQPSWRLVEPGRAQAPDWPRFLAESGRL